MNMTIDSIPYVTQAIDKLRVYAADDGIDCERLAPLLSAFDSGDCSKFLSECRRTLPGYAACDCAIDELLACAEKAKKGAV